MKQNLQRMPAPAAAFAPFDGWIMCSDIPAPTYTHTNGQQLVSASTRPRPDYAPVVAGAMGAPARARAVAGGGRHAEAIALCTEALGATRIKAVELMNLLDLRAESCIALGDLDRAAEDATAMVKFAAAEDRPMLMAQALNRKALVQMRQGELKQAVKTPHRAARAPPHSGAKPTPPPSL
mgnify:CR=1 FL=1